MPSAEKKRKSKKASPSPSVSSVVSSATIASTSSSDEASESEKGDEDEGETDEEDPPESGGRKPLRFMTNSPSCESDELSSSTSESEIESEEEEEEEEEEDDDDDDGDDETDAEEPAPPPRVDAKKGSVPIAQNSGVKRASKVVNGKIKTANGNVKAESSDSSDLESEAVANGKGVSSSDAHDDESSSSSEQEESPTINRKAAKNSSATSSKHQKPGKAKHTARAEASPASESESDSESPPPKPRTPAPSKKRKQPDSGATQSTDEHKRARHSSGGGTDQVQPDTKAQQNQRFQRVSSDIPVESKFQSNAYRPYDYAERAHRDLAPTKGKQFTKEKNKKKRGSYRGGVIDVHGKKGIKFD